MTATSASSRPGKMCSVLSMTSVTCAKPIWLRFSVPPKITSSILAPRSWRLFCSPMTQRMASEILDLPEPFGPTMAVMSSPEVQHRLIRKLFEALDFQSPKVHESITSFMFAYNN